MVIVSDSCSKIVEVIALKYDPWNGNINFIKLNAILFCCVR